MSSPINSFSPQSIFTALTRAPGSSKETALRAVEAMEPGSDRTALKLRVVEALKGEHKPPPHGQLEELQSSDARSWLLSALGRIADDEESADCIRDHLSPAYEPDRWARYWALEGLIAGRASDLEASANEIIQKGEENVEAEEERKKGLVLMLAHAVLAVRGLKDSDSELRSALKNRNRKWAALRALRVVPIDDAGIVNTIIATVKAQKYDDVTYDAIVALGQLPSDSKFAESAADALAEYLAHRRWGMFESMRVKALTGLGHLAVPRTAHIIREELVEESPSIVAAAARALEATLGVDVAVSRVVEDASAGDERTVVKLASALRYMDRTATVEHLERAMITGPESQREAARRLMSEVGGVAAFEKLRARGRAVTEYLDQMKDAEDKVTALFERTTKDAKIGFWIATAMDISVFILGLGLIGLSAAIVWSGGSDLEAWVGAGVSGGGGVLGVIYGLFVARPRTRVTAAVRELMRIKIVFLGYLRQLHQADNAYTRRLLDEGDFPVTELKGYSTLVAETMKGALAELAAGSKTDRNRG